MSTTKWLEKAMRDTRKWAADRIRRAGKHVCVAVPAGEMSRVTGRGDRILKRPVVVLRLYECKVCGRNMTPNNRIAQTNSEVNHERRTKQ